MLLEGYREGKERKGPEIQVADRGQTQKSFERRDRRE
jgi:hypothetical protein